MQCRASKNRGKLVSEEQEKKERKALTFKSKKSKITGEKFMYIRNILRGKKGKRCEKNHKELYSKIMRAALG